MKAKKGKKDVNKAMQREVYVSGNRFKSQIELFNKHLFLASLTLIFFCFVAIASAPCVAKTPSPTPTPATTISSGAAIVAAIVVLIAFALLIYAGVRADKELNKGEMRRAIAGTFVVGFTVLMILSLHYGIYQSEIIVAYIEFVGIVIGFYFGQRSAATATKT